jgi:hypothetical protein
MPKYRVLNEWFDGVKVRQPGEEVEFDGEPGASLEPIDNAAKAAKAKVDEKRRVTRAAAAEIPLPNDVLTVGALASTIAQAVAAAVSAPSRGAAEAPKADA